MPHSPWVFRPALAGGLALVALLAVACRPGAGSVNEGQEASPSASRAATGAARFPVELAVRGPDETGLSPRERTFALPLNNPSFVPVAQAGHMRPEDLVVGIEVLGRARAYPWWIVKNYHVVNDTLILADTEASRTSGAIRMESSAEWKSSRHQPYLPLLITLCEACAGASAFVPVVANRPLVFNQVRSRGSWAGNYFVQGTYTIADLQTHSRWHPFTGLAGSGPLAGTRLVRLPAVVASWQEWAGEHPETLVVLGAEELRAREHSARPRVELEQDIRGLHPTVRELLETKPEALDGRLPPGELVLGVGAPQRAKALAIPLSLLRARGGFVQLDLEGEPYLLLLHRRYQTAVYRRRLGPDTLSFKLVSREPFRFEDQQGSQWDVMGRAVSGPRAGRSLEPAADAYLTAWSEWVLAHPDCQIVS